MAFAWVRPQQELDPEVEVFSPESDEAEDNTGDVLDGRYELREAIAWGGTAAVYKAFDRHTKIFVAVKVLSSGLCEQIGAYFGQEGRVAAAISNPHLVRAHDRGIGELPYIVFELVPGQPLSQLYFERPMPWRELCEVMLPVLDALDALHQEGIVHRDVKPDNLIVQRRIGRESRVSLLDVGFAAVPPGRISNSPAPDEIVFGTFGYIAPEYFAGHPPEPRSDLYSVGALMYTMLTTRPVLDARELGELLAIPPPRVLAPGAEIPEAVEDVVMRALSDVEARFQSAREMAEAIRAALAPPVEQAAAAPVERVVTVERVVERVVPGRPSWRWLGATLVFGAGITFTSTAAFQSLWTGEETSTGPIDRGPEALSARHDAEAQAERLARPADARVERGPERIAAGVERPAGSEPLGNADGSAEAAVASAPSSSDAPSGSRASAPSPSRASAPSGGSGASTPSSSRASTLASANVVKPASKPAQTPATGTFAKVMATIEPKVRACATENGISIEPRVVKVRGADGTIESVRVLGMSSQHAFARCVDGAVREARPPLEGGLATFEFFRKS